MPKISLTLLAVLGLLACAVAGCAASPRPASRLPVIHCTDLFHPADDPDDHFDLATLYGIDGLELKAVILDQGDKQLKRPGTIPVSQMNQITGRQVPAAIGLKDKLRSPEDQGLDQPPEFQRGVELLLNTLRQSPRPVIITAVGSLRDVAAAFNREPDLFRRQVAKLMVFSGDASDQLLKYVEWNVNLDPQAFLAVMRSGLPVYWVPCFDGGAWKNHGHASFWLARQEDLLQDVSPPLLQYFIYALDHETADPLAFLSAPVDPERRKRIFAKTRNLWGAALFNALTDQTDQGHDLFGFSPVDVTFTDEAQVRYGKTKDSHRVMRFEIRDQARYAQGMTAATAAILSRIK